MFKRSLLINPRDNVAVVLEEARQGDHIIVNEQNITLLNDTIFAHKVALQDFQAGDTILKYGEDIGFATRSISKGEWIHTHNMGCKRGK